MQSPATIFVSIASYRDPELIPTLKNMIGNAERPAALHISVCWQHEEDISYFTSEGLDIIERGTLDNYSLYRCRWQQATINIISVHYFQSKGACWARNIAEQLYRDENWFLQIDSHCRFAKYWDSEAIAIVEKLYEKSDRPVLSSFPPGYNPEDESKRAKYSGRPVFGGFTADKILSTGSVGTYDATTSRTGYLAGGFIFAPGKFAIDVPNDPEIFFLGEEIAMAARAFTHGYDIYFPGKVLLWHYYGRREQKKVWGDHNADAKKTGDVDLAWFERDSISKQRVRSLLGYGETPCDLGRYGLGHKRTLKEFEAMLGVHFASQKVLPEVIGSKKVNYFPPTEHDEKEWLEKLVFPIKKTIKYDKSEIELHREDLKWWHFGVYNETNDLLEKKELTPEELTRQLAKSKAGLFEITFNFATRSYVKPSVVRACPFYENGGWGDLVEKKW